MTLRYTRWTKHAYVHHHRIISLRLTTAPPAAYQIVYATCQGAVQERFIPFFPPPLATDEAERRFGRHFAIERIGGKQQSAGWPPGWAAYLMTRQA